MYYKSWYFYSKVMLIFPFWSSFVPLSIWILLKEVKYYLEKNGPLEDDKYFYEVFCEAVLMGGNIIFSNISPNFILLKTSFIKTRIITNVHKFYFIYIFYPPLILKRFLTFDVWQSIYTLQCLFKSIRDFLLNVIRHKLQI